MSPLLLIALSLGYLGALFGLAQWAERKRILTHAAAGGWVYVLSLAVYCSAWTFYGSIGRASTSGLDFLTIYLGPVAFMPLWWVVARKMIRIARTQHIASLADFLVARYGKKQRIGTYVSLLVLIAITPYISLQIKALGDSFSLLSGATGSGSINPPLVFTLILCAFTLIYGMRYLSGHAPRTGMVTAVAAESVVKLVAFLWAGGAILTAAWPQVGQALQESTDWTRLVALQTPRERTDWFWMLLTSGLAFFLLPRQFQVGIIENQRESHVGKAMVFLPLYFLFINLLVIPLALAGNHLLPAGTDPDTIFLGLGNLLGGRHITLLIYLGGFAAATGMIIVSSLALGNMVSTNLVLPAVIRAGVRQDFSTRLLNIKRLSLVLIFILAYAYYELLGYNSTLVSIGMTSFAGISQLAPAFLGALYWKGASHKGALAGILVGFTVWGYGLILPNLLQNLELADGFLTHGPWGIRSLSPLYLGHFTGMSHFSSVAFLSLSLNTLAFLGFSVFSHLERADNNQAELFVNIYKLARGQYDQAGMWQADVPLTDVKSLLIKFLGDTRTEEVLDRYARINRVDFSDDTQADPRMIGYAERLLTEAIGPASARIMIASLAKGEEISLPEVLTILEENKEALALNRALKQKTTALEQATTDLKEAHRKLLEYADLKDEFLYTVTHELRTPLTAIRSQAELLLEEQDMEQIDREAFLTSMVKEAERLTRLISNVLDLEKFESGNRELNLKMGNINHVLRESAESLQHLFTQKGVAIKLELSEHLTDLAFDHERMHQVATNLLSNAIKYTPPKTGIITVTSYVLNQDIKVNVSDNGPGIDPADVNRIFDKFFQVRNQTRKKPSGTGLGLAICKNIIQMHQGTIWIQAQPGGGTRVSFTIPLSLNETANP